MAQQQQNMSLTAPGFAGLNTQDSPLDMDPSFAAKAENCVIDQMGRIASRKGFNYVTTNPITALGSDTGTIDVLGEFVNEVTGETTLFACGEGSIFIQETDGSLELISQTLPLDYVVTGNNWQMAQLNNKYYFVQALHAPLLWDPLDPVALKEWTELPPFTPSPAGYPNCVCAAFGRLWVGDFDSNETLVAWSGLLNGEDWTANGTGTLQTSQYWPGGYDEITAMAAHNNFMILWGLDNILIYQTTADVANSLSLVDTVEGIGCTGRDSVQPTGTDYLFVDSSGVRSLNRTIQEKSIPIGDISRNIRDDFQRALVLDEVDTIKAVFHHEDNFYACFLPSNPKTYVFDTWQPLPDGSARATVWTGVRPLCAVHTKSHVTYFGGVQGVYTYEGAADVFVEEEAAGEDPIVEGIQTIPFVYHTHPMDFGSPANLLFPKQVDATVIGGLAGKLALVWGYDYGDLGGKTRKELPLSTALPAVVWDTDGLWDGDNSPPDVWTADTTPINQLKYNIWGSGRNVALGFEMTILGDTVSIQEINLQVKQGRLL